MTYNRPSIGSLEIFSGPDASDGFFDLYVEKTTLLDWEKLIDFLASSSWPAILFDQGRPHPVADLNAREISESIPENESPYSLSVQVGKTELVCNFLLTTEIEFNLSARNVREEKELSNLMDFMADLSTALEKDVKLAYEAPGAAAAPALLLANPSGAVRIGPGLH